MKKIILTALVLFSIGAAKAQIVSEKPKTPSSRIVKPSYKNNGFT